MIYGTTVWAGYYEHQRKFGLEAESRPARGDCFTIIRSILYNRSLQFQFSFSIWWGQEGTISSRFPSSDTHNIANNYSISYKAKELLKCAEFILSSCGIGMCDCMHFSWENMYTWANTFYNGAKNIQWTSENCITVSDVHSPKFGTCVSACIFHARRAIQENISYNHNKTAQWSQESCNTVPDAQLHTFCIYEEQLGPILTQIEESKWSGVSTVDSTGMVWEGYITA